MYLFCTNTTNGGRQQYGNNTVSFFSCLVGKNTGDHCILLQCTQCYRQPTKRVGGVCVVKNTSVMGVGRKEKQKCFPGFPSRCLCQSGKRPFNAHTPWEGKPDEVKSHNPVGHIQ